MRTYLLTLLGLLVAAGLHAQHVTYDAGLTAGESFIFEYHPTEDVTSPRAHFYATVDGDIQAEEVQLTPLSTGGYQGVWKAPAGVQAVAFAIAGEDETIIDNNEKMGYVLANESMGGDAFFAKATYYASNMPSRRLGIDRNLEKAHKYAVKGVTAGELSDPTASYMDLLRYAGAIDEAEKGKDKLMAYAKKLEETKKPSDGDYYFLVNYYDGVGSDSTKAEKYTKKARKHYPTGQLVQQERLQSFYETIRGEIGPMQEAYNAYVAVIDPVENASFLATANRLMASKWGGEDNWEKFDLYLNKIDDPMMKASLLNSQAWPRTGQAPNAEAPEADLALAFAEKAMNLLEDMAADDRPREILPSHWERQLASSKSMFGDTYALALFQNGKKEKALEMQLMACKGNEYGDFDMNERLAIYFSEVKPAGETEAFLASLIQKGKASGKVMEMHRELFMDNNDLESAYASYLDLLQAEARAEQLAELKKKMMDKEAPSFTLTDLDGNTLALADMKGKVKVVDFWATWCGPCKASFPAMQEAQNKYANRDDVVFLFVNSWENGDREKNAREYITANDYSFRVLMDEDDAVIKSFGVRGIPTKFIIDGNNHIRFESVGWSGSSEKLIQELSMMIDLASGGFPREMSTQKATPDER